MGKLIAAQIAASSTDDTFNIPANDGSAGEFLKTDGSGTLSFASAAGGFTSMQFITSGNWTRPTGVTKVIVEVQGAGAGGGHSAASASGGVSGGGGAGGYVRKTIDVSSIASATIGIGAGGGDGADGGDTTWSDGTHVITGTGGIKGENASGSGTRDGGLGGVPTVTGGGTHFLVTGQSGINGHPGGSPSGGNSMLGLGGVYRLDSGGTVGGGSSVATGYGAGGCGSKNAGSATAGGSGSGGIVIVWEFT